MFAYSAKLEVCGLGREVAGGTCAATRPAVESRGGAPVDGGSGGSSWHSFFCKVLISLSATSCDPPSRGAAFLGVPQMGVEGI